MAKEPKGDRAAPKFGKREDLEAWLKDKPREVAVAIAARAALRVVPLAAFDIPRVKRPKATARFLNLTAAIFRATVIGRVVAVFPRLEIDAPAAATAAAVAAAVAADDTGDVIAKFVAFAAASAADTAAYGSSITAAALAAERAVRAAEAWSYDDAESSADAYSVDNPPTADVARFTAAAAAWRAVSRDAAFIMRDGEQTEAVSRLARELARNEPLWFQDEHNRGERLLMWLGEAPRWVWDNWTRLRDTLPLEDDWQVWIDWYQRRLDGVSDPEEIELVYATVPEEKWNEGPAAANRWIKERLEKLGKKKEKELDPPRSSESQPITVPAQKPATLEPIIRAGRIALPDGAAEPELDAEAFKEALKALRSLIGDLASDLEGEANIDKRAIGLLRRIGERIPEEPPTQAQLFELAHQQETLEDYCKKVVAEWPDLLASRYLGVVRAFDGTMRQFAKWRTFKQNALKDRLTEEQRVNAPILARKFAGALREAENAEHVETAIPAVIENMARQIDREAEGALPRDDGAVGADTRPEDLITSIDNTIKRIGDAAAKADVAKKAEASFGVKVAKGFAGQFEGEKLGENLGKWATGALLAGGASYVGVNPTELGNILAELMQQYPIIAQWLQPLMEHLKR